MQSWLFFFFSSFSASGVWLVGNGVKSPGEDPRGDGGTASTSLMPGVGGIRLGSAHNGEQDWWWWCVWRTLRGPSLILRVMHSSNLCNYKQVRKKFNILPSSKTNVPHSSRETFTSLSSSSWMGFNEASQEYVCVCGWCTCISVYLLTSIIDRLCL